MTICLDKFGVGGHFDQSLMRFPNNELEKIICFISGKCKQLNHKISQQLVVTKDADFSIFSYTEFPKYPDTCGQGLSALRN